MDDLQRATAALTFNDETRAALWQGVVNTIESYWRTVEDLRVSPVLDVAGVRSFAESFTFEQPLAPEETFRVLASALMKNQVHTPHPQYFGLFNPATTAISIAADTLVAALNPQLAAWSHSPLAAEMERHLVLSMAEKFGMARAEADGVFTSGGAEANQTALLAAMTHRWPEVTSKGLRGLAREPVFYISAEGHHSLLKAARAAGLGANSVREIEATDDLQMDLNALRDAILSDQTHGCAPFLVVATAGTTGAGAIDRLRDVAGIAQEFGLWFHVDAAWGGAAALVPELRPLLDGIELADSITFDAHKWLSVPMGAGMFLTRHSDILNRCFATHTAYMPKEGDTLQVTDPFTHSLQWSRRFIGCKLFLSLATAGWGGYSSVIRQQTEMGELLRESLVKEGWQVVNRTPLPLVCFTDAGAGWDAAVCQKMANAVVSSGQAWISTIQIGRHKLPALRACITNYRTEPRHVAALVNVLNQVRLAMATGVSRMRKAAKASAADKNQTATE